MPKHHRAQPVDCSFHLFHATSHGNLKQLLSKNNDNVNICLAEKQHLNNLFTLQSKHGPKSTDTICKEQQFYSWLETPYKASDPHLQHEMMYKQLGDH